LVKSAIIGGTNAWLKPNEDKDNFKDKKNPFEGYEVQEDASYQEYGPYYEPKGLNIEKSMLQFLIDN